MDRNADGLLKRVWDSAANIINTNIAATSVARSMFRWIDQLEDQLRAKVPREEIINALPLLKMATGFMADASDESVRFAAKNGALSNSARRALWLRTWSGDTLSKNKLCSIPFSGAYVFGPVLDEILEKAVDKKRGFPQERPKSKPSYSFRRKPQKTPEYSGKGKTRPMVIPQRGSRPHKASGTSSACLKKSLWAEKVVRSISAVHLRDSENKEADFLSRNKIDPGEWSLKQQVFNSLVDRWGKPEVDLFATGKNTKVEIILLPESIGRSRKGGCPVSTQGHGIGVRISPDTLDPGSSQEDPEGTYQTSLSGTFLAQEELVSSARETSSRRPGYAALGRRSLQPGPANTHKPQGSKTLSMDSEWGMLKSQGFSDSHLYHTKWQETASKATIARWMKSAIQRTYQSQNLVPPSGIKAHSTRAVSTSWAEKAEASVDQICKAATWRNIHTFYKHYRLDLNNVYDLSFGRKVLQAVIPP
ncbi:hypothetical protein PRIEUP_LOCUS16448 [Pristimantis euphronides]